MTKPLPKEMLTIEMNGAGGPEVLQLGSRPIPQPSSDEVLVKVSAAGVNGPDLMQRKGLYPPPEGASDLLGLEISGEVVFSGNAVICLKPGDKVCALVNGGGYAEYCLAKEAHCLPAPDGVSLIDAAGLPETYFTIWSNIFMGAALRPGERLLVHGGAGGLGTTAIQLGKAFGSEVFATDHPEARRTICQELGADRVVDYVDEDFVPIVREAGGADVILDIVGGNYVERNIKASAPDARIVQLAFALGSKVEIDLMPIMLKRLRYTGSTLRSRSDSDKAEIARQLRERVWPLFGEGKLQPVTNQKIPMSEATQAHVMMESASHTGKVVLIAA